MCNCPSETSKHTAPSFYYFADCCFLARICRRTDFQSVTTDRRSVLHLVAAPLRRLTPSRRRRLPRHSRRLRLGVKQMLPTTNSSGPANRVGRYSPGSLTPAGRKTTSRSLDRTSPGVHRPRRTCSLSRRRSAATFSGCAERRFFRSPRSSSRQNSCNFGKPCFLASASRGALQPPLPADRHSFHSP